MKLKLILQVFGLITVILTLLPILDFDYWFIRVLDFPHVQLTCLTLASALLFFIRFNRKKFFDYFFLITLFACFVFQLYKILPYTPLSKTQLFEAKSSSKDAINLFTANVLQKNKNAEKIKKLIPEIDADIMVLTETNTRWLNDLKSVTRKYAFKFEIPLPNSYGMLLYSKYELIAPEVRYLVDDSIPSIYTKLRLPNNDIVQLFAIHPTPPVPKENTYSSDRDAELMMVAELAKNSRIPVIVLGDLNDVAWSETSSLFKKISGLLDARIGRGFYNTYSAESFILRWPLDHIFVSKEFRYKDMRVCRSIDSDHFPLFMSLIYKPELAEEQRQKPATAAEIKNANQQIEDFKNSIKKIK